MKLDNSNGRYIIIIAGILLLSVILVSLAFASEGWNRSVFTSDDTLQSRVSQLNSNGKNMKREIPLGVGLLPITDKCVKKHVDTLDEGWIYLYGYNIPDALPTYLDDLSGWYVNFVSYGGYELTGGKVDVYQYKFTDQSKFVGTLTMSATPTEVLGSELASIPGISIVGDIDDNAQYVLWAVSFALESSPLQFNSNYLPELFAPEVCDLIDGDDCGVCWPCGPSCQDDDFDKEIKLKFYFDWEGCPRPDQDFQVILTYKCMFPESPTPD